MRTNARASHACGALRVTLGVAVLAVVSGCVGSAKPYRPYKGEERPDQVEKPDPIITDTQIRYPEGFKEIDDNTVYYEQTRKEIRSLYERVHRNKDGSPRNAWVAFEDDMVDTLGADAVKRRAPKPKKPQEGPVRRPKPGEGEGEGGEKKPAGEGGDKPADGGGDKPADKPADGGASGGGESKPGE